MLLFQARHNSLTLQFRAELHFDNQTIADWSQFCCKAMSNLILICSLQLIVMVVGRGGGVGRAVEVDDRSFSR